jgi:hypothetical protein
MSRAKRSRDPIPQEFKTVEEAAEFWDTHSLADYEDLLEDVDIDVDLQRWVHLVAIEPELRPEVNSHCSVG